jgi:nucleoside-diphosphate-sugar epimerase
MSQRILITGATGLIGRALADEFRSLGHRTIGLSIDRAGESRCDENYEGSANDPELMQRALRGGEVIVHLAALRSPNLDTPLRTYTLNTSATFNTLSSAAESGVKVAIHASSISVLGFSFSQALLYPSYFPIDEAHPKILSDPYGLSKVADEETVRFIRNRYKIDIYAPRFPYVGDLETLLAKRAAKIAADDSFGTQDFWAYLEIRDAVKAIATFVEERPKLDDPVLHVVAPNTLARTMTRDLMTKHFPRRDWSSIPTGYGSLFDSAKIQANSSFRFQHLFKNEA